LHAAMHAHHNHLSHVGAQHMGSLPSHGLPVPPGGLNSAAKDRRSGWQGKSHNVYCIFLVSLAFIMGFDPFSADPPFTT
jgi:hypothetical protein